METNTINITIGTSGYSYSEWTEAGVLPGEDIVCQDAALLCRAVFHHGAQLHLVPDAPGRGHRTPATNRVVTILVCCKTHPHADP